MRIGMSEYKDYTKASRNYDKTRKAYGLEIILGHLSSLTKPLHEQTILDAGCGTGNYIEPLKSKVKKVFGVEANSGMLEIARRKFKTNPNVDLRQGQLPKIPFENELFDGVILNQVVHHLKPSNNFEEFSDLLQEAFRVIRPEGTVIINTCGKEQIRNSYWPYQFLPQAQKKIEDRYIENDFLQNKMETCGFHNIQRIVPTHVILQGDDYYNCKGPFDPAWRDGDSTWSLASDNELEDAQEEIKAFFSTNDYRDFFLEAENKRKIYGQCIFICGRKESASLFQKPKKIDGDVW